jgi:RNA recognition motif-containing protein
MMPAEAFTGTRSRGVIQETVKMPRIYIGNLAESVTPDDLTALFSRLGKVSGALVITDKISGRSRGFGFVEMVDVDEAIDATGYFNNTELDGLKIQITPYRPRPQAVEKRKLNPRHKRRSAAGSAD